MAEDTLQMKLEADYDYKSELANHSWLVKSAVTDGTIEVISLDYAQLLLARQQNHYLKQLNLVLDRAVTLAKQLKDKENE